MGFRAGEKQRRRCLMCRNQNAHTQTYPIAQSVYSPPSPSYEAAIRVMVETRIGLGLSQRELAERLGKSRSFVSKIENRERRLDFVELVAVARAMELIPSEPMAKVAEQLSDHIEF
jgi:ribosome-binding protein aMBF1 (putative translation factor)